MRTTFTKQILLALIAALACAGVFAAGALAAPGGLTGSGGVASSGQASAPAPAHVHKTGIATWFGPGFYGQRTACGQTLTPAVVGVANRTLPCGTLVKVSYKGRRLTVPVIDRGPYANGADWDLTSEAARTLGLNGLRAHRRPDRRKGPQQPAARPAAGVAARRRNGRRRSP